jgi:hypothetical protein
VANGGIRAGGPREIERDAEMAAATRVRWAFVASLVGRRHAAEAMLAYATDDLERYTNLDFDDAVLLQISPTQPEPLTASDLAWPRSIKDAVEARLPNVLFVLVAGSVESTWTDQSWRDKDPRTLSYLDFLERSGYELSAIERAMTNDGSAEHAHSGATSSRSGRALS